MYPLLYDNVLLINYNWETNTNIKNKQHPIFSLATFVMMACTTAYVQQKDV